MADRNSGSMSHQASSSQSPSLQGLAGDNLTCQWAGCGERCTSAEALYDHVCERHVGRKSTNNLNLTCQWGTCRTTTVKRDHITSHIRVHVPLKPHKCDHCGKAFKRPQDLKKHVKTHAPDDSGVLPEPVSAHRNSGGNGFSSGDGRFLNDMQAMAPPTNGFYGASYGRNVDYGQHSLGSNPSMYGGSNQGSAYGPVYYPTGAASYDATSVELRKRAVEALNDFLGDAKRRSIDPGSYYDVGSRLSGFQSLPLPAAGGYSGYGDNFSSSDAMDYTPSSQPMTTATPPASQGADAQQYYVLPLSNMRTKDDLMDIDQFLEQLQATVYESQQPPTTPYVPPNTTYRTNNSPPYVSNSSYLNGSTSSLGVSLSDASTPALTPASSTSSYMSPRFGSQSLSPSGGSSGNNMGRMYPNLPSASSMPETQGPYTSSAPAAALGGFDYDNRRRYSGGLLQKAARPARTEDDMDTRSDTTPTQSRRESTDEKKPARASPTAKSNPYLGDRRSEEKENDEDRMQEAWVENIRTIERLRAFIKYRLETREYDESVKEEEGAAKRAAHQGEMMNGVTGPTAALPQVKRESESLYPVLQAVKAE